jgi:protein-S-isoprenylcysteine O-methyltransferase Ste14
MTADDGVRADIVSIRGRLPRATVPAVLLVFVVTLGYSVLVTGTLLLWVAMWVGLGSVVLALFVVYLLYRLVLAVERIADAES